MEPIKPLSPAQFIEFCIQYASLTLVYYDYLLTLRREVKYVWMRKFHVSTVMFFFCRYSTVANIIFAVGLVNKFYGISCDTAYTVSSSLSVLGRIGILTLLAARTCALFQYNKALVALFGVMGLTIVALSIAHVPHVSCTGSKIKESRIATDLLCVLTVIYEILATSFLAFGCYRSIRSAGSCKEQKNGLMFLMLKEGLLYSGFVTVFTTAAMILNYAAPLGSFWQRLLNALTIPISGLMAARFLLHVRAWQDGDMHTGYESTDIPSAIQFNFSDPSTRGLAPSTRMQGSGGQSSNSSAPSLTYLGGSDVSMTSSFASSSSSSSGNGSTRRDHQVISIV